MAREIVKFKTNILLYQRFSRKQFSDFSDFDRPSFTVPRTDRTDPPVELLWLCSAFDSAYQFNPEIQLK